MRGFPFGALSSSDDLAYGRMMWPCAEREAPHANSLSQPTMLFQIILFNIKGLHIVP